MPIILGRQSTDRLAANIFYSFLIVPVVIYNIPLVFCFLIGISRNKKGKDGKIKKIDFVCSLKWNLFEFQKAKIYPGIKAEY